MRPICVDASVIVMLLVPEKLSLKARSLCRSSLERGQEMVAPPLLFAEVTSVLRRSVFSEGVPPEDADRAFGAFMRLEIKQVEPPDLQPQAWALAKQYDQRRAYDAQYLAVATTLGCDLWTGDRKLVNAINEPWVKWVGDYEIRAEVD